MRIKVAMIEEEQEYLNRLATAFSKMYADKLEMYSFSNVSLAIEANKSTKFDVLIASDRCQIEPAEVGNRCAFAYLVDVANIERKNGHRVISKYQKIDSFYKEILALYAEVDVGNVSYCHSKDSGGMVIAVTSPTGGVGVSTVAAGCAMYFVNRSKKVLYLDMTQMGQSGVFFQGDGNYTLSDLIYATKSNSGNIYIKLESMVRKDASGVYFFESCGVALDVRDCKPEDLSEVLRAVKTSSEYDVIIVDMSGEIGTKNDAILEMANIVIMVSDGTALSNLKLHRAIQAYRLEDNIKTRVMSKTFILYNRYHSATCKTAGVDDVAELGGIEAILDSDMSKVAREVAKKEVFHRLYEMLED